MVFGAIESPTSDWCVSLCECTGSTVCTTEAFYEPLHPGETSFRERARTTYVSGSLVCVLSPHRSAAVVAAAASALDNSVGPLISSQVGALVASTMQYCVPRPGKKT